MDAGLSKTFRMPYSESHHLQFRWEVFNLTNTQPFGQVFALSGAQDPYTGEPDLTSGVTSIRKSPWAKPVRGA